MNINFPCVNAKDIGLQDALKKNNLLWWEPLRDNVHDISLSIKFIYYVLVWSYLLSVFTLIFNIKLEFPTLVPLLQLRR